MSLSNEVVNIYSDYTILPNTFTTYIIPSTGINSVINITLPKIYNNTLQVESFRITNNSTYNVIIKYIANADDDTTGTLTTLVTITGGSKAHVTIDDYYQKYEVSDSSIDSSGVYLPLTGGTLTGNLNVGSIITANINGKLSAGKTYITGISGGLPSTAISDLDIAQSSNLDMTTTTKTAGITLYGAGSSAGFGTIYTLGIDITGGFTLYKANGTVVSRVATFDASSGITSINQTTPTANGGGGQIANKTYVDNRYTISPITIVPIFSTYINKHWSISATSEYSSSFAVYNILNNGTGEWAVNGASAGSIASFTIYAPSSFYLGGFGISSRASQSSGINNMPIQWTISATTGSAPFTTLYTGTSRPSPTFTVVNIDFKSFVVGGNISSFNTFKYSGTAGGGGDWGITKFELYAATPVS